MKKINDDNLKKALHLYTEKAANSFPDEETVSHINFSDEFEQKMNDIIKKRKNHIHNFQHHSKKSCIDCGSFCADYFSCI